MEYEITISADTAAAAIAEARRRLSHHGGMSGSPTGPVVLIDDGNGTYHTKVMDPFAVPQTDEMTDSDILAAAPAGAVGVV